MDLVHRWMDVDVDGGSIAADSSRQAADSGQQSVREREERCGKEVPLGSCGPRAVWFA